MSHMFDMLVAGILIRVENRYPFVENQCRDFKIYHSEEEPDIVVKVTDEGILQEQEMTNGKFSKEYCESICVHRAISEQLYRFDAFVFHASVVSVDGEGYAFTAKSGVGKSTHTRYWIETFGERAYVVNGDKPIIRYKNGKFYACGTPWRGKENWGNKEMVPLHACSFLTRGTQNRISRIGEKEILLRLFHQVLMPNEEPMLSSFLKLIEGFVQEVPFYQLECTKDIEAAKIAYQGMKKISFRKEN